MKCKASEIALNKSVNERTARRTLRESSLISAVRQKNPILSENNVKTLVEFCQQHKNWSVENGKCTQNHNFISKGIQ